MSLLTFSIIVRDLGLGLMVLVLFKIAIDK